MVTRDLSPRNHEIRCQEFRRMTLPSGSQIGVVRAGYCASRRRRVGSGAMAWLRGVTSIDARCRPSINPSAASSSYAVITVLRETPSKRANTRLDGSLAPSAAPARIARANCVLIW